MATWQEKCLVQPPDLSSLGRSCSLLASLPPTCCPCHQSYRAGTKYSSWICICIGLLSLLPRNMRGSSLRFLITQATWVLSSHFCSAWSELPVPHHLLLCSRCWFMSFSAQLDISSFLGVPKGISPVFELLQEFSVNFILINSSPTIVTLNNVMEWMFCVPPKFRCCRFNPVWWYVQMEPWGNN